MWNRSSDSFERQKETREISWFGFPRKAQKYPKISPNNSEELSFIPKLQAFLGKQHSKLTKTQKFRVWNENLSLREKRSN